MDFSFFNFPIRAVCEKKTWTCLEEKWTVCFGIHRKRIERCERVKFLPPFQFDFFFFFFTFASIWRKARTQIRNACAHTHKYSGEFGWCVCVCAWSRGVQPPSRHALTRLCALRRNKSCVRREIVFFPLLLLLPPPFAYTQAREIFTNTPVYWFQRKTLHTWQHTSTFRLNGFFVVSRRCCCCCCRRRSRRRQRNVERVLNQERENMLLRISSEYMPLCCRHTSWHYTLNWGYVRFSLSLTRSLDQLRSLIFSQHECSIFSISDMDANGHDCRVTFWWIPSLSKLIWMRPEAVTCARIVHTWFLTKTWMPVSNN